jgi:polyhydroxybutyrate depolymerase
MDMPEPRLAVMLLAALILLSARPVAANAVSQDSFGRRDMLVYVPAHLPPRGARALVIVLHGGLGNARRIASGQSESGLNLNAVAERNGFVVAYLNGTPATRLGFDMLGWNAGGGCCGQSAARDVDDVGYIQGAVGYLTRKYGVDPRRVFGIGHSNGAMMTQRLICETDLYAAAVAISGPLNVGASTCPAARGKRILAIHGAEDENVPVAGGWGTKGLSGVAYRSEAESRQVFTASGASYDLDIVRGADHYLDHIAAVIQRTEGQTIAEKAGAFFGLMKRDR